jgi:20S proteasome alpha/beta subunit
MITAGNIQYEPFLTKIWNVTPSIAVLAAGDINIQALVFGALYKEIAETLKQNQNQLFSVKEVAVLYHKKYAEEKKNAIERKYLSQYGLTMKSLYIKRDPSDSPLLSKIDIEVAQFSDFDDFESLIIGIDEDGPHIFSVDKDGIMDHDVEGFAARGIGMNHAESYLMVNKYTPNSPAGNALMHIHRAKKYAEVAPNVGRETDIIAIGPQIGFSLRLPDDLISCLDKCYRKYENSLKKEDKKYEQLIIQSLSKYMKGILPPENQPGNPSKSTTDHT